MRALVARALAALVPALSLACLPEPSPPPPENAAVDEAPKLFIVAAQSLEASAARYADFRASRGWSVEVVGMRDVIQGTRTVDEVRAKLHQVISLAHESAAGRPFAALLLGDANTGTVPVPDLIPPDERSFEYDLEVTTDNAYADLDGDDLPDFPLGRIPVRTDADLDLVRAKVDAYESNYEPGPWSRRFNVFASTGGFGSADALLEQFAFTVFERMPPAYDITMTYAKEDSPYVFVPERFSEKVYDRINEGSLVTAYVGHGDVDTFADLDWRGTTFPILDTANLSTIDVKHRAPILTLIACLTGGFDRSDSLSERIIRAPGGPPAILSSTEISHPLHNGVFIYEMSQSLTRERPATVGELFVRAKHRLFENDDDVRQNVRNLSALVLEPGELEDRNHSHAHMYTLFGDPTMRIAYAKNEAVIFPPATVAQGAPLPVHATLGALVAGTARVTFETSRQTIHGAIAAVPPDGDATRDGVIEANYAAANDKVLVQETVPFAGATLETTLTLPADLAAGTYLLKVYADDGTSDALGGLAVEVP